MITAAGKALIRVLPRAPAIRLTRLVADRTQRPVLGESQRHAMLHAAPLRFGSGRGLKAWSWGRGPTVVLVHGWNGCAGQLAPLAMRLAATGLRCVALDVTGHGHSAGTRSNLRHFIDDTAALTAAVGGDVFAYVGHSAGGLAVTAARAMRGLRARHYVCIGTPAAPTPPVRFAQQHLALRQSLVAAYQDHLTWHFDTHWQDMENGESFAGLGSDLLLIHDENDRVVDPAQGDRIRGWCPGSLLVKTRGYGHTRLLESPQLTEAVVSFLSNGSSPALRAAEAT